MPAKTLDPLTDPAWDDFLAESESSVFHASAWMAAIAQTYGIEFSAAVLTDDIGEIVAGLPYAIIDDARSRRSVSLPFSDFCDPLVTTESEWSALADQLVGFGIPVTLRCKRSDFIMADPRFRLDSVSLWHGVDISSDLDSIRSALHRSARNKINKAQREGIQVDVANEASDMRKFFDLHLRVRKYRHGLLAQPYSFFEAIREHLIGSGQGLLLLAKGGNEVIGGTILLQWRDTLFYKYSAMEREHMNLGTNDLVLWSAIIEAKRRGLEILDLGLSDPYQSGLVNFKRKFATSEREIRSFNHEPPDVDRTRDGEFDGLMSEATRLFTSEHVPDSVTEAAGDRLYRYFA